MTKMLQLVILLTAIAYPTDVRSNTPSDGPTTNEPLTRGVNEVGCNSTSPVFRCDEFSCVSKSSVCNGVPDCPDGQDESVQQCGCLPNEFSCSDSCVDIVKRCDRKVDCPEAEDEFDCKSFTCPATHFKCNNFYCIPIDLVCNFEDDCGDKSDEADCKYRNCWNPEFRCNNGECIRPGFICDGRRDCKDGSDESNCGHDQFVRCGDGQPKHKYYWCDGWPDCPDNQADEIDCRDCKGDNDYLCPNGRCISKANVCDSQCDCAPTNGTVCADEVDCEKFYISSYDVSVCRLGETLSCSAPGPSKSNERCISSHYICDGINHCYNGHFLSDETGCDEDPSSYDIDVYKCADNRTIPATLRCDFKYDCLDGDDEAGCPVVFSTVSLGVAKTFERRRIHKEEARIRKRKKLPEDESTSAAYRKSDWITNEEFGSGAFLPICLLNMVVLLAWRFRPVQPIMVKYFLANPASPNNSWPMLFSAFSHISGVHFLTNMYVLYSFTQVTVSYMGPEQFTGFYFASAVVSSFASYVARVALNRPGFSLGASGAVMAVLGYACTLEPDARLGFAFIPFITMKAGHVLAGLVAADIFGLFSKGSMFDHAAHLGGTVFGIFWATIGSQSIWHSDHVYDVNTKKKKR